jgi:hypothetical protein
VTASERLPREIALFRPLRAWRVCPNICVKVSYKLFYCSMVYATCLSLVVLGAVEPCCFRSVASAKFEAQVPDPKLCEHRCFPCLSYASCAWRHCGVLRPSSRQSICTESSQVATLRFKALTVCMSHLYGTDFTRKLTQAVHCMERHAWNCSLRVWGTDTPPPPPPAASAAGARRRWKVHKCPCLLGATCKKVWPN